MSQMAEDRREDLFVTTVRQVADEIGVDPVELPPLYQAIDPTLIDSFPELATLSFPYQGYTVVVRGDGNITVREPSEQDREPMSDYVRCTEVWRGSSGLLCQSHVQLTAKRTRT